jgi:hypothetical protein
MPARESGPQPDSTVQPEIQIHTDIAGKIHSAVLVRHDLGCGGLPMQHSHDHSEHAAFTLLPICSGQET